MNGVPKQETAKRRSINLTIRGDIINEAKSLKVNASQAAEAGILEAIKRVREKAWIQENQRAVMGA